MTKVSNRRIMHNIPSRISIGKSPNIYVYNISIGVCSFSVRQRKEKKTEVNGKKRIPVGSNQLNKFGKPLRGRVIFAADHPTFRLSFLFPKFVDKNVATTADALQDLLVYTTYYIYIYIYTLFYRRENKNAEEM